MRAPTRRAGLGSLACVVCLLAACSDLDDDAVSGSGTIVSEEREVSGFTELRLEGRGDVTVDVGDRESLTIETDDNLLELITTEVTGSRLVIRNERSIDPSDDVLIRIGAVDFEGVSIAGSADVAVPSLDCGTFTVSVTGSGDLDLDGRCDRLEVEIRGSGDLDAEDLVVETADIDIAGSGDVVVNATDDLLVSIAGSGDVEYLGDPATSIDVRGSGEVQRRP